MSTPYRFAIACTLVLFTVLAGCRSTPEQTASRLITFEQAGSLDVERAGFDVDDTLLFSTPAFAIGFASNHEYGSDAFWTLVNSSDRGNSEVKIVGRTLVDRFRERGVEVYAITARSPAGGDGLRAFLEDELGIPAEHVYFEPDQKTDRIQALRLDVYFGDSDSDIKDAQDAGVRAIRIQRSSQSSYRNADGSLRKYHPGMYDEEIVAGSKN